MSPIDIEDLEKFGKEVGTVNRASRAAAIVAFLGKNKSAYTQTEIGKAVGIASTHANQVLRNLCEKGKVVRKTITHTDGKQLIYYGLPKKTDK
jgi:predicted transcriptional regulator